MPEYTKEAADLLRELAKAGSTRQGKRFRAEYAFCTEQRMPDSAARAYLDSLEKPAEESVPDPAKWVSVEKVREVLRNAGGPWTVNKKSIEDLLPPKPRSADDALAQLQTFLAVLSPDETISPSTRKWMMERVKEARGIR